jgi:putative flippase GtrA
MFPWLKTSKRFTHFTKYFIIGVSTFAFDLALLFLFAEIFHLYYVISAGLAYLVAITINYLLSRHYVFSNTLRSAHAGYAIFLLIAGVGFVLVTGFVYFFVQTLGLNLFVSRVLVAAIVGVWNYFMNLYVNFKVDPETSEASNIPIN